MQRSTSIFTLLGPVLLVASLVVVGCSYQVVSPPARMVSLETAGTVAPGETVVGARAAANSGIFDPGLAVTSGGIRRGVAPQVEVDADVTWARVLDDRFTDLNRNIYAGRLGAKIANRGRTLALLSGAGGGYSPAGGGFTAADVGAALSYPNCYAVPFLNGTGFVSVPVGAKRVDFVSEDGVVVASDTAATTLGYGISTGVEVPLVRARCRGGLTSPRIQLGVSAHNLYLASGERVTTTASDGTTTSEARGGHYGVLGLGAGVEFPF